MICKSFAQKPENFVQSGHSNATHSHCHLIHFSFFSYCIPGHLSFSIFIPLLHRFFLPTNTCVYSGDFMIIYFFFCFAVTILRSTFNRISISFHSRHSHTKWRKKPLFVHSTLFELSFALHIPFLYIKVYIIHIYISFGEALPSIKRWRYDFIST